MPETPEIRAHAERLTAEFEGAVLEKFVPISFTALKTYAPAPDVAYGSPLLRVGQRGKYLSLVFEPATFVVHLMQGGRLKPDEKQSPKPRGGLARWVFTDGRALLLSEAGTEKRAGVWVVEELREGEEPIAHLGPDADSLDAAGVGLKDLGLVEMHEAFAAQILSNLKGLASPKFAKEELGRDRPVGVVDLDRFNVTGGSISIGHPFGATGARATVQLLSELARRDENLGLLTVCAAGGVGFAMVFERE